MVKIIEFNFIINYDYLKDISPNKKGITVINNNFESQAAFGMKKSEFN